MCFGFVTLDALEIPCFTRYLRYKQGVEGILYLCSQKWLVLRDILKMGYQIAGIFNDLCQEEGQDTENDHDYRYLSGRADSGL